MSRSGGGAVLDRVALSSQQQKLFRAVALVAPCVFLALVPLAGGVFHPVFTAAGVLLAVVVALVPDSHAPLGLVVYLGGLWMIADPGLDLWTLAAAAALFAGHLACALASYGPPGLVLDRALLARWRGRTTVCLAAAVLVWLAATSLAFLDLPPDALAVGAALLVLLGWVGFLTVRLGQDGPD
jgi:hypothetical protein